MCTEATFGYERIAISKPYLLTYPGGGRRHITREERDNLLLSQSARQTGAKRYLYIGPIRTFHSFRQLEGLYVPQSESTLRRFLAGSFIFVFRGRKKRELMQTPEGLALELAKQNGLAS